MFKDHVEQRENCVTFGISSAADGASYILIRFLYAGDIYGD